MSHLPDQHSSFGGTPLPPPSTAPRRSRGGAGLVIACALAALAGTGIGAGIAAAVHRPGSATVPAAATAVPTTPSTPAPDVVQAATVKLCTSYATANAATPNPQRNALEVMPETNYLKQALADNPDARADVRAALTELVNQDVAQLSAFGRVRPRGYAVPPEWHVENLQAAIDRAYDVCGLGG